MESTLIELDGRLVRLEALTLDHAERLAAASADDVQLYRWSPVPQGRAETMNYIRTAINWREAGTAQPFAIVRKSDGLVVGSTRFWNIERWQWPDHHERGVLDTPDVCEIGYTWLKSSAVRTGINRESKLLMLSYAFEQWRVLRVCLHTNAQNERSRRAIESIGAKFEGILRAHRIAADSRPRDSARYSILLSEWPYVRRQIEGGLGLTPNGT